MFSIFLPLSCTCTDAPKGHRSAARRSHQASAILVFVVPRLEAQALRDKQASFQGPVGEWGRRVGEFRRVVRLGSTKGFHELTFENRNRLL